eukprot:PhM_4_TR2312/c0_g1_i2/m.45947
MARLRRHVEIWALCMVWPITGVAAVYGGYRALMWSYGGRDEFRRQILLDPNEKEWFMVNPRKVFFRDAPLSNVPTQMPDDIKALSDAQLPVRAGGDHPHVRNW